MVDFWLGAQLGIESAAGYRIHATPEAYKGASLMEKGDNQIHTKNTTV